jgi:hypothetical protein
VTQFLRLYGWRADGQLTSQSELPLNPEVLCPAILPPRRTPKFHWLDIFEIWEFVTISYSPITNMQQATFTFKALTALLTAWWWILRLAWVSSLPPLSLRCAEAVTYLILKVHRFCFSNSEFQEIQWGFFLWNSKIGNESFLASRNVTMSHRLCLLPVTDATCLNRLITLITLKYSARQWCGHTSQWRNLRGQLPLFV